MIFFLSPAAALAIYFVLLPSPAATAIAAGDYSFIVASYVAVVVIIILYFLSWPAALISWWRYNYSFFFFFSPKYCRLY